MMVSSFYTHVLFILSCIIFSFSLLSFISRVQIFNGFFPWEEALVIYHQRESFARPTPLSILEKQQKELNENLLLKETSSTVYFNNGSILKKKIFSILDRFVFINPSKTLCNHSKETEQFLIIVVLSRASNFDYRQAIRATWGRNGKFNRSRTYVQTVFFVGTDDGIRIPIRKEQDMFNDVVEIGIPEQYPFVAHKELASILWTRLYCPFAQFVFRADDDILLDIFLLLKYIEQQISRPPKVGIHGWFRFNNTVHRADKWSVTKLEYPSPIYPPYTFGIGYLFSNVTGEQLIRSANHSQHQVIRIGDAYITGILRDAAQLPFYDFIDMDYAYTFVQPLECDDLFTKNRKLLICMSKAHIGMMNDPYEFYDAWDVILTRYNLTLYTL